MKYVIASNNRSKREELQRILSALGIEIVTARELGHEPPEPEENGETFEANALIKAKAFAEVTGLPAIADDSGLCVDALGGRPGVQSARYGGDHDAQSAIDLLLSELQGVPMEQRGAYFACSMCCYWPDGKVVTAEGRCDGAIAFERQGDGGFGFDPVFLCKEGGCFGTMTDEEKDRVSHRGIALRRMAELLAQ
ncbi:MAG: RdgB/HAM1 family non-canonical purine NTP pyrophosphatase [Ruminococcaceae bacterium]|nr:RdgB/HAM1 family non-canonical purine NTP pyrophosphatase [Oscillospiraceae bacterium]